MSFRNYLVTKGGQLVRQFIRSPNYVAGSAGWTVNKDGSVEFNNGTFRGTVTAGTFEGTEFVINSLGAFFYSGPPGTGNLIASITAAAGANDGEGNAFKAGVNAYGANGTAVQLLPGATATTRLYSGDSAEAEAGLIGAQLVGSGALRFIQAAVQAPRMTGEAAGANAVVAVQGPSADLSVPPQAFLQATDGTSTTTANLAPDGMTVSGGPLTATQGTAASRTDIRTDTWHAVTPPAGWSGTLRYKLSAADNMFVIDCQLTNPGASAGTITLISGLTAPYSVTSTHRYIIEYLPIAAGNITVFSGSVQTTVPASATGMNFTVHVPLD